MQSKIVKQMKTKNDITDETDIKNNKKVKTLKVRIFPSDKEKNEIKLMMDQQRWYYNATLSIMTKKYSPEELIKPDSWSYITIRDLIRGYEYNESFTIKEINNKCKEIIQRDFIKKDNNTDYPYPRNGKTNEAWWNDINGRVVRGASKKFTMALNSGITNLKNKNINSFKMSYMSRKEPVSYLHFDDGNYPSFINKIRSTYWFRSYKNNSNKYKTRSVISLKNIIEQTKKSSIEVIYDKIVDKYYVHIPVDRNWYPSIDIRNENQMKYTINDTNIISLDPGVRKFLVGYDPKGNNIFFGEDAQIKIIQLLLEVDKCKDETYLLKWRKISNLISELHWKCINYLVKNYKVILLPDFRVSQMLKGRKLGQMTKRLMSMFSFYKFKEKLIYKCEQYNKKLYIVDESFTSKCCGVCGNIDKELGSKKVYTCKVCEVSMDRDSSGARNILLKHLKIKETI